MFRWQNELENNYFLIFLSFLIFSLPSFSLSHSGLFIISSSLSFQSLSILLLLPYALKKEKQTELCESVDEIPRQRDVYSEAGFCGLPPISATETKFSINPFSIILIQITNSMGLTYMQCVGEILRKKTMVLKGSTLRLTHLAQLMRPL